jgi:NitT/TauT family transport system substrate-binding protein
MRVRLAVFAAVTGILAAACGGTPAASPTPTASLAAATSTAQATATKRPCCTKVVAAYSNISADDWVAWYAFEKGVFKENGLEVDLQSINGGAQTSAALLSNSIQIGQFGGSEALGAVAGGADLVVVGNMAPVYPYVLYSQKDIKTIDQLKGKQIGVSNIGGSSDIATRAALKSVGLDPTKDVDIVAVGSHSQRTAALLAGKIAAGVDDPPEDDALVKAGLNPLIDLASKKLPTANTGIVVQRSWLNSNKDTVQAYIDATVQARAAMLKDKQGALDILDKYFQKKLGDAGSRAYDFFIAGANAVTPVYPFPATEQFAPAIDALAGTNPKIKDVDLKKLIDTSYVQSAKDRKIGG